jgi:beta-1,4-N-acetylglucosaminyltransferase
MKVAYICSHGGHLTELSLLSDLSSKDAVLISYHSPRTEAFAGRKYLFDNFGQKPWKLLTSLPSIIYILLKEKPNVIISNGAEIAIPFIFFARLIGIRSLFIEVYTRIDEPTITGKLVYPFCSNFLVLWPEMLKSYGSKAKYYGGLVVSTEEMTKTDFTLHEKPIFVMVGMHYSGFNRLIKEVDKIAIDRKTRFIVQIGHSSYEPRNVDFFRFLESDDEIERYIQDSSVLITHGGISAIEGPINGIPTIVVPRLQQYGEHINDHQLWFSKRLEADGFVTVVTNVDELNCVIDDALKKDVKRSKPNPFLRSFISDFIIKFTDKKSR